MAKLNILIVEDTPDDAELTLHELRRGGIEHDSVRVDTEEGLRRALEERVPDIVLSDFTLPGFGGMTALEIVKEKSPETPFVFVSGTIGEERAIETIKQGATDYLLKDSPARLATAVQRALEDAEVRRQRRRTERELRETKERLDGILGSLTDVVWSASADRTQLLYVNPCAEGIYGHATADLYANPLLFFQCIHPEDRERMEAHWASASDDKRFELEYRIIRPDGTQRCLHHRGWGVRDEDGEVARIDGIVRDVTDRRRYEAQIEHLATHDGLTDLPNRNLLNDRLGQMVARAARTGGRFAVLFLDVDRFKYINDSFGHLTGDKILKAVASRLRGVVRTGDTVARLGGDEFVVVITDLASREDAGTFTNKLLQEVFSVPFLVDGRKYSIEASVGVSMYPADGTNPEILLRNADAAMYGAKERGRDCVQFYTSEMAVQTRQRVEMEQALRLALENREFELSYQPQVDLHTGQITGVEALIRWHRPTVDLVLPARFIPLAEQTGLILPIGEWVLHTACEQARRWHRAGHDALSVAVNVSACQFQQEGIIDLVERVLKDTGLDPTRLEIELTESTLLQTSDAVARSLQQLKSMGIKLSLDDFGTGYSSLVHVKYFPIDTIKIDQSFIHDLNCGVDDSSIVKAIIAMARSLGIRTVAEGVESAAQLDFLRANRCDAIQGHYFSPSLSADALTALIDRAAPL